MTIGGIGGANGSYAPKPAASGGNVAQLEQQKKAVQEEIKSVQDNDKLKPEEKQKKLDILQQKLQKLEQAIQKASKEPEAEEGNKQIENRAVAEEDSLLDTYA